MSYPQKVTVTDVGPRDGLQIEPEFIPTGIKIELINGLIDAGVPQIEFSSFMSPRAVPQLADAEQVLAGLDRSKGTVLIALIANAKGAERAAAAGVDEICVVLSASESHNRKNVNRSVDDSLQGFENVMEIANEAKIPVSGAMGTAFGCPFEGNVLIEQVGKIAQRYHDLGMVSVGLGDTTGMATPSLVRDTCRYLQKHVPELPVTLHFHNTRGIGLVNVIAGLDEGITSFESSFAGLGGCPFAPGATGNICTEDLVNLLHEMNIETGIDLDKLCAVARHVEEVVGRDLPGQVMKAGPRLNLHALDAAQTAVG